MSGPLVDLWPSFIGAVRARLEQGEREYGGRSFSREPAALLDEIAEETLDIAAWGYILWTRLRKLEAALADATRGTKP